MLVAAIIVALRQMRHAGPGALPGRNPSLVRHSFVVWGILILFALGTAASVVPRLYTVKRLAVGLLPYGLLAAAWAMGRLRRKRLVWGLALGLSLAASLFNAWGVPKTPWREVVATIDARLRPGDVVWVDGLAMPVFDYYHHSAGTLHPWQVGDLDAIGASLPGAGRLWLIAEANRYRDLFDFYPALSDEAPAWSGSWPGIEVRAYDAARVPEGALAPQSAVPEWALNWPSPLDEACRAPLGN